MMRMSFKLKPKIYSAYPIAYDSILKKITEDFHLSESRKGIHMSDCIYCLRKVYYNQTNYLSPTPKEVKYFVRGIALQDAILQKEPIPIEKDGIIFSPDYWDGKELLELKTTTMGRKRMDEGNFPKGWIKQIAAYCYALGISHGYLLVFILNDYSNDILPPYRLEFSEKELLDNWNEIVYNKSILEDSLKGGKLPLKTEEDWLCNDCRYALRCKHDEEVRND